mmetsp:Transcript_2746/g.9009  ORF Transcript_2746/g.9009 Transcript_2746/m.9009 type:complete len:268 (-) Transcript_2746:358-1161(-)
MRAGGLTSTSLADTDPPSGCRVWCRCGLVPVSALLGVLEHLVEGVHVEAVHVELHLLVPVVLQRGRARPVHQLYNMVKLHQGQLGARVVELLLLLEGGPAFPVGHRLPQARGRRLLRRGSEQRRLAVKDARHNARNQAKHGRGAVVGDAVVEDELDVRGEGLHGLVLLALEQALHGGQVHGLADHRPVVVEPEAVNVNRVEEPLGERVAHQLREDELAAEQGLDGGHERGPLLLQLRELLLRHVAELLCVLKVDAVRSVEDHRVLPD